MKTPKPAAQTQILPGSIAPPAPAPSPDVQTPPPEDTPEVVQRPPETPPPHPRRNWTVNDVTRTSRGIKNASPAFRSAALVFARDGEVVAIFTIANLVSAVSDAPEQTTQPEGGATA